MFRIMLSNQWSNFKQAAKILGMDVLPLYNWKKSLFGFIVEATIAWTFRYVLCHHWKLWKESGKAKTVDLSDCKRKQSLEVMIAEGLLIDIAVE